METTIKHHPKYKKELISNSVSLKPFGEIAVVRHNGDVFMTW